jgi:hypothetical protein
MDFALPIAIIPVTPEKALFVETRPGPGLFQALSDHFVPHARNNYYPHIFSPRLTGLLSALLVAAKVFTLAALAWGPITPAYASAITTPNIINLTNQSRQAAAVPLLTESILLDNAAQQKANDMLAKGYFSHNTPGGQTPWDFITAAGYNYITAGENLAVNFTQAENVETAWMNSPDHRSNILDKNYQNIGVGIAQGLYQGHEAIFVVQMFGTLAGQKINLSDVPTPVLASAVPLPAVPAVPAVLAISDLQTQVQGSQLVVSAAINGPAVKVLATYGRQGIMLAPGPNNSWSGSISLSDLAASGSSLALKAYNMAGTPLIQEVADFAGSTPANYNLNLSPQVAGAHISIGPISFNPAAAEKNFYLIFIALILACLIVALAVKRHIQHISLMANGAFMAVLAVLLLVR